MIGGLERQKDARQVSAYKKMMAIVIGGIFLLAALIALLVMLLAPGKSAAPFSGCPAKAPNGPRNPGNPFVDFRSLLSLQ